MFKSMTDSELKKTVLTQNLGQFLDILIEVQFSFSEKLSPQVRVVQNFSAKGLRRRFIMWWHMKEIKILVHFRDLIFAHFLSGTPITWQTKILVQSQNQKFSAFSNNSDLTCPKLSFHDSLILFSSPLQLWIINNEWSFVMIFFYFCWQKSLSTSIICGRK